MLKLKKSILKLDAAIRSVLDKVLPRNLTVRYLSALGAVAILAVIGQIVIQNSLAIQAENQKRLSEIERQINDNEALRRTVVVFQLSARAPEMRIQLLTIQNMCDQLAKNGATLELSADKQEVLNKLLVNCQTLTSWFGRSRSGRDRISTYQIGQIAKELLQDQAKYHLILRETGVFYEQRMAHQIIGFKRTELLLLVITLLVLLLEALYVFRPSVESLYEALRVRSDFLGRMGHEVRNPMNSILGMANLLAATSLTEQQKKYLTILRKSSGGLLEMLNNLLDFSVVESGKMRIEKIPFNLYDLLGRSIDLAVFGAHAQGIELVLELSPDVPLRLIGDPVRLQQVLANLLGNAIKFTPQGQVTLRVQLLRMHSTEAVIQFSVIDTGIGIEKEKTRKIFDAFVQEDSTVRRRFGGTGLGLSISREIVERFGGKLEVESEKSVGSHFHFSILFSLPENEVESGAMTVSQAVSQEEIPDFRAVIIEPNDSIYAVVRDLIAMSGGTSRRIEDLAALTHLFSETGRTTQDQEVIVADYEYVRDALKRLFSRTRRERVRLDHFIFLIKTTVLPEELEKLGEYGVRNFLFKPVKAIQFIETLSASLRGEGISRPKPGETSSMAFIEDHRALRILVVDDSKDNQFLIKTYLEALPYRLVFADDGREAVEKIKATHFDLILMDLQMPEMDGYTATRLIREWEQSEGLPSTPLVAVSAQDKQRSRESLVALGFSEFLAKPVGPGELRKLILDQCVSVPQPRIYSTALFSPGIAKPLSSSEDPGVTPVSPNPVKHRSVEEIEKHLLSLGPKYLANRREDIHELRQLMSDIQNEANLKMIQNIGHKMKGNARSYGFDELGMLGARLEESVQKRDLEGIPTLVESIERFVTTAADRHSVLS